MTVSTTSNSIQYTATGNASFSFPFAISTAASIEVTDNGTTVPTTSYNVALNAPVSPNPTPVGGTVTFITAPASGNIIVITRDQNPVQSTSFTNQGTLWQQAIEQEFDYLMMSIQEIRNKLGMT